MYVSNAFDGVKGGWFLNIDVVSVCHVKDQEVVSNKVTNAHDKKRRKKTKNDLHDGDHRRWIKFSRSHNIDDSKKSPEISCVGKEFCVTSLEGLLSKLNHKDAEVLQNPWIFEKPTKKRRRKSSKCHEEAHLAIPSETLLPRSPRENTLPHSSGKEAGISIFFDQRAQYNGCDPSTNAAVGLNNFNISQSQGATNHVSSSESTEDTPHHLRRFRVVKKIPIRRQKRMPNVSNPEILFLHASSRYPGDASGTFPDCHLGEMQERSVHL
ncbi:hypothetical protein KSP39_PZI012025 [Platanthera zijinensis]|uniref:Uncharacterized protein n=1 Tax=Platanthera zijinensis TaxID=2320716 RepID=A0AAP0BGQ3_9ASPA